MNHALLLFALLGIGALILHWMNRLTARLRQMEFMLSKEIDRVLRAVQKGSDIDGSLHQQHE